MTERGFSALAPSTYSPFTSLPAVTVAKFVVSDPKVLVAGGLVESILYPGLWF